MKLRPLLLALSLGVSPPAAGAAASASDTARAPRDTLIGDASSETPDTALVWLKPFVVTGSRTRQQIHHAPASISVITDRRIATAPASDYGDLVRRVPGLNVTQLSARDVQIVGRNAAGTLASSELAIVDGRTINLDFFGLVMWDLVPLDTREIRQIEVMRSPGSAVWGANAMAGVVNVVTKRPKEMLGTSLTAGGGERGTAYGRFIHAASAGRLSYKLTGSTYTQDPFERPAGTIPGTGTPYPPFRNRGTKQAKLDVRVDYDPDDASTWILSGGVATTEGLLHSGIGPFDVSPGTRLGYTRTTYRRGDLRLNVFVNLLDGDASNLLSTNPDGSPISFRFETQTYTIDASNTTPLGGRNRLTYGASARRSDYDITLAPLGRRRDEAGGFVQDELVLTPAVRLVAGLRWDYLEPAGPVLSPRTSISFTPHRDHTLRASFNRAFRAPTVLNNYIAIDNLNTITLPTGAPYQFPSLTRGNPDLGAERMTAFEVSYLATLMERLTLGLAVYRNHIEDGLDFYTASYYDPSNPPPGWPLPASAVPPNTLPERFGFQNRGQVINRGLEASIQYAPRPGWFAFFNYSFQDDPEVRDIQGTEVSIPPRHRVNVGVGHDGAVFFGEGNLSYVDKAYWVDVLDARFWGWTEGFTQVSVSTGVRVPGNRVSISLQATNLFDARVQQHVFGDIVGRRIVGAISWNLR